VFFAYLPNNYPFILSFSSKRELLSKVFCIFALEHRLIVLMGQKAACSYMFSWLQWKPAGAIFVGKQ